MFNSYLNYFISSRWKLDSLILQKDGIHKSFIVELNVAERFISGIYKIYHIIIMQTSIVHKNINTRILPSIAKAAYTSPLLNLCSQITPCLLKYMESEHNDWKWKWNLCVDFYWWHFFFNGVVFLNNLNRRYKDLEAATFLLR